MVGGDLMDKDQLKENRLNNDMEYIISQIVEKMEKPPTAIYLCGGYGRGEGAWIFNPDGSVSPYNDYDFSVITDYPLAPKEYTDLRKELAAKIGISWIDIDFYPLKSLKKMSATIKNVDLLYASKFLYGEDILKTLAPICSQNIGVYDVLKLYRTRIWTFLGSWDGSFHSLQADESCFFKNQMAKAVLAACDMILISEKAYTPRYYDRVERACEVMSYNERFCVRARWALHEKLNPSMGELSLEEMKELYFECKMIFDEGLRYALKENYKYFEDPEITKRYYFLHTSHLVHDVYNKLFRNSKQVEKSLDLFIIQNYVYRANCNGVIEEKYIIRATELLKKWDYIDKTNLSWDELHRIAADARNNA